MIRLERFHSLAERELNEAAQFCETESPGLGFAFLMEVERCIGSIVEHPEAGNSKSVRSVVVSLWEDVNLRADALSALGGVAAPGSCYLWSMRQRLAALSLSLLAISCSVGPKTIPRDQFDYGNAIASAGRDQILKNIVGLRYAEAPVFVDVASVINQYALEGEVAAGAGLNDSITGSDTLRLGGASRWADRPTITYTPISGRKFATSLLTPLPPESLFALVQGGWPAELVLRMTVRSINGIENAWAGAARRRQADPRFNELLRVWERMRDARVLGLRRSPEKEGARIMVYIDQEKISDKARRDLDFFYRTLNIDPGVREVRLAYGLIPDQPNEIVVLTASILELMNELAWRIDVPPGHLEDGRTMPSFELDDPDLDHLISIRHAAERPEDAFVAVESRGFWFYIDDRDVLSKRTFALVQILLSLTDTSTEARGPVVSIIN